MPAVGGDPMYSRQPTRPSDAACRQPFVAPRPSLMSAANGRPAPPRLTMDNAYSAGDDSCPSYCVEHLATFGVGPQFGLQCPNDGILKLKQMERSSAIWAQRMVLRLQPNALVVLDENGDAVENFPLDVISEPTAHVSNDARDLYNNLLLFVVNGDAGKGRKKPSSATPTEMHIFQCVQVSAGQVVDDIKHYLRGQYRAVAPGRRAGGGGGVDRIQMFDAGSAVYMGGGGGGGRPYDQGPRLNAPATDDALRYRDADQRSTVSDSSLEFFERDVNTLNRCFDDIERFVARIQSAAIAQRELEALQRYRRTAFKAGAKGAKGSPRPPNDGILMMRAQLPAELEFFDVLQKFKLCFNLLAKLKNHIHDPNAPELLHFLFTPLSIILDASHWAFGRNVASQVVSPLLSRAAKSLLLNCLTSKESEVWASLGDSWRFTADEWRGPVPGAYTPTFADGFVPYTADVRSGHNSTTMVDAHLSGRMNRVSLERERLDFEKEKLHEEERRLIMQRRALDEERRRLLEEKRQFYEEQEQRSVISERIARPPPPPPNGLYSSATLSRSRPELYREIVKDVDMRRDTGDSAQQRAFMEELRFRGDKAAQVTYERPGQNSKELSVRKGELLQVLDDRKNWWQCRNAHGQQGFVPHTILSPCDWSQAQPREAGRRRSFDEPLFVRPPPPSTSTFERPSASSSAGNSQSAPAESPADAPTSRKLNNSSSPKIVTSNGDLPDAVRQRRGKLDCADTNASSTLKRRHGPLSPVACEPPVAPPMPDFRRPPLVAQDEQRRKKSDRDEQRPKGGDSLAAAPEAGDSQKLFSEELQETLKRSQRANDAKRWSGRRGAVRARELSCVSSCQDVADWLRAKSFSSRAAQTLRDCNGERALGMSKAQLVEMCGAEEGARLFAQLQLQKSAVSPLNTPTRSSQSNELDAILAARRSIYEENAVAATAVQPKMDDAYSDDEDTVTIAL